MAASTPADARPRDWGYTTNDHSAYSYRHYTERHHYKRPRLSRAAKLRQLRARKVARMQTYTHRRKAAYRQARAYAPRVPAVRQQPQAWQQPVYGQQQQAAYGQQQALPNPVEQIGNALSNVVAEARRYLGGNPTGKSSLWCARFMNMVLERSGHKTTGSDMANSFASYGRRVSGPQIGAIAVMSRGRRGGHVGVVSGIDAKGNPIVVSGNHSRRVAEATYNKSRVYAYVMPN